MKKLFLLFFVGMFFSVSAQERVSLALQESKEIYQPFSIQSYKATPEGKIKISEVAENKLLITGLSQGECELLISGGSVSKKISISVVSNLKTVLKKLKNDLQELGELDISVNQDIIVLRGNLSKYEKWKYLNDVLSSYDKKQIRSYVKFVPSAETVINLKKTFETMGYKFSEREDGEPGTLFIKMSPDTFFLSAKVFSEGEQNEILNILKSQAWLELNNQGAVADGKIKGVVNISVVKTQVVVDIAFIALTKKDADTLGSQGGLGATMNFGILYDIIAGRATSKTAQFGGDINRTINFLSESGVTRIYKAGSVSFTNGASAGGYLKVGGTQYVKVGREEGDLKEINYGFIVTVKGTILNRRQINLNLDLEYSHMADTLKKEDNTVRTERIIEFDKTAIVGGFKDVTRNIGNAGLPILRNTPVVQWFVGEQKDNEQKSDLLILACPRVYQDSNEVQIEIPVTKQVSPIAKDINKTNSEYKEEQKKYSGWLYWLNWFVW